MHNTLNSYRNQRNERETLTRLDEHFFVAMMLLVVLKPESLDEYFAFVYRGFTVKRTRVYSERNLFSRILITVDRAIIRTE